MTKSGKGFVWYAINSKTDYCQLSKYLAESIKNSGTEGKVAVITDAEGREKLKDDKNIDHILEVDIAKSSDDSNFLPEFDVFSLTPFTHTIKLEADMFITQNISWWWYHLCQHDLVFSHDCLDYKENKVTDFLHRKLFLQNNLPNIYNGLSYFRHSQKANSFYMLCRKIGRNWEYVRENLLKNCNDRYPTTDVVYAMAAKLFDPLRRDMVVYDFFRMIHYKNRINNTDDLTDIVSKHLPFKDSQKLIVGQHAITKPMHYHHKDFVERIHHA